MFDKPIWEKLLPDPLPEGYQRPYTLVLSIDDLLVASTWDVSDPLCEIYHTDIQTATTRLAHGQASRRGLFPLLPLPILRNSDFHHPIQ